MVQKIVEKILKRLTIVALKKQRPWIITITGSIGKTSTKEAIYNAIKNNFKVRRSQKNYNNEIGVPMTVLGQYAPGKNIFGWLKVFFKFLRLGMFKSKKYPKVLILEIGSDKPGDLKYLMEMLPQDLLRASVLTAVTEAHLEFFGDMEGVFKEKITPFFYLTASGFIIINKDHCDSEKTKELTLRRGAGFITYSIENDADVMVDKIRIDERGVAFTIKQQDNSAEFLLKNAIAKHQAYALLAGVCVGKVLGVSFAETVAGLRNYTILAGRMRKIEGINRSLIIDDTYNSSPLASVKALEALSALPYGKRKIAVLGDMLEMGNYSEDLHRRVGKSVVNSKIKYVFTLGKQAKHIFNAAIESGFPPANIRQFHHYRDLSGFLKGFIEPDDVILIKASQGMRLERVTKSLMANLEQADTSLVRQNKRWLKK